MSGREAGADNWDIAYEQVDQAGGTSANLNLTAFRIAYGQDGSGAPLGLAGGPRLLGTELRGPSRSHAMSIHSPMRLVAL
jgi:hypothetical protein